MMSLQRGRTRLTLGRFAIGWDGPQDSRALARQPKGACLRDGAFLTAPRA